MNAKWFSRTLATASLIGGILLFGGAAAHAAPAADRVTRCTGSHDHLR